MAINGPYKVREIESNGKSGNHTDSAFTIRHIIMQCGGYITSITGNIPKSGRFGDKNRNITLSKNCKKTEKN